MNLYLKNSNTEALLKDPQKIGKVNVLIENWQQLRSYQRYTWETCGQRIKAETSTE
jgi:hypothetical protein